MWASQVAQLVKNCLQFRRAGLIPELGSSPWRRDRLPIPVFLGFPDGSDGKKKKKKNPPAMQETWFQSLDWEDPLEEGIATHSSILTWSIPMDRRAWRAHTPHISFHFSLRHISSVFLLLSLAGGKHGHMIEF